MTKIGIKILLGLLVVAAGCGSASQGTPDGGLNGGLDGSVGDGQGNGNPDDPLLIDLEISPGALLEPFAPDRTSYAASFSALIEAVTVTPTANSTKATIAVNGQPVLSGTGSPMIVLSVGMNPITIEVTAGDKTKRYDVLATRKASDYLKASNTGLGDQFGYSISLLGDTLAVGAPYESSSATGVDGDETNNDSFESGAVYVFTRSPDGAWSRQACLKASNTGPFDHFGSSVSLSGDTLAVGAPSESSSATGVDGDQANHLKSDSGAVYVFTRSTDGKWSQKAYLKASNTYISDFFGRSVSLSGDTLAVGAVGESSSATGVDGLQGNSVAYASSGAVYVFTRSLDGNWSQRAYLKASNTGPGDRFGSSVSLSGDTLAVGAPYEDSNASGVEVAQYDGGAVYVFARASDGNWSQQAFLKASNAGMGDNFGYSVSLSGDTLAVGAPMEDSTATGVNNSQDNDPSGRDYNSGAVYVFARASDGIWSQQAYLKASNTGMADNFGYSVSLVDNALLIGSPFESSDAIGVNGIQDDDSYPKSGAGYLFKRSPEGEWMPPAYLKASNTGMGDGFGYSVSISGETAAVGAFHESSNATGVNQDQSNDSAMNSGAVYVF
jgi:hypothetical protein